MTPCQVNPMLTLRHCAFLPWNIVSISVSDINRFWDSQAPAFPEESEKTNKQILASALVSAGAFQRSTELSLLFRWLFSWGYVNCARWWCRPRSWEDHVENQRMATMRKLPGHVCCAGQLLVHIPPPRGSWEQIPQCLSEGGQTELVHPLFRPWQQLLRLALAQQWPHTLEIF